MKNFNSGITIIETLIIIAVLVILISVIAPSFITFRKNQALENTTYGVVSLLKEARSRTLSAVGNTNYSVRLEKNRAVLFPGNNFDDSSANNEIYTYEKPVEFVLIYPETFKQISFERLTGSTSDYGTLTLSITGFRQNSISITNVGNISKN